MKDSKLTEWLARHQVKDLPPQDVLRISAEMIAHMEETRPEVWFMFLYELGMDSHLSRYLASSPFVQSEIHMEMQRQIRKRHPKLDHWQAGQIRRAMQGQADGLISKYLKFTPPPPRGP